MSVISKYVLHRYFKKRQGLLLMVDCMVRHGQMTVTKSDLQEWMFASKTKVARLIREGLNGGIFTDDRHTVTLRPDWEAYIDDEVTRWP